MPFMSPHLTILISTVSQDLKRARRWFATALESPGNDLVSQDNRQIEIARELGRKDWDEEPAIPGGFALALGAFFIISLGWNLSRQPRRR
jgi:hypothetical protein